MICSASSTRERRSRRPSALTLNLNLVRQTYACLLQQYVLVACARKNISSDGCWNDCGQGNLSLFFGVSLGVYVLIATSGTPSPSRLVLSPFAMSRNNVSAAWCSVPVR